MSNQKQTPAFGHFRMEKPISLPKNLAQSLFNEPGDIGKVLKNSCGENIDPKDFINPKYALSSVNSALERLKNEDSRAYGVFQGAFEAARKKIAMHIYKQS